MSFPLWLFNDTDEKAALTARITVEDADGKIYDEHIVNRTLEPYSRISQPQTVLLPDRTGDYILRAELVRGRTAQVKYPVVSKWDIRTFRTTVPAEVAAQRIYIPADESGTAGFRPGQRTGTYAGIRASRPAALRPEKLGTYRSRRHRRGRNDPAGSRTGRLGGSARRRGYRPGARLSPGKRRRRMGPLQGVVKIENPARNVTNCSRG